MDLKTLFGTDALTYEQFAEKAKDLKLVDLNEGEYVAKGKYDKADKALKEAQKTIEQLEANKGNTDELEKELQKYKDAETARQQAEEKATRTAQIRTRFDPLKGENKYLNEGTENWIFSEFEKALSDKQYEGKSDAEVYAAITKDKNIYVNPNEPFINSPVGRRPAGNTMDDYLKSKYKNNPFFKG